jgi:hypothetical protein
MNTLSADHPGTLRHQCAAMILSAHFVQTGGYRQEDLHEDRDPDLHEQVHRILQNKPGGTRLVLPSWSGTLPINYRTNCRRHAKADQVRMARDVAGMFDELRGLVERQAGLHTDHAAELKGIRDELELSRQDAHLWREEADRERARIANMQADAEHTEREMTRLQTELEQARRPWWRRLLRR